MRNAGFLILLWAFLPSAGYARDGGKISWQGKGSQDRDPMANAPAKPPGPAETLSDDEILEDLQK